MITNPLSLSAWNEESLSAHYYANSLCPKNPFLGNGYITVVAVHLFPHRIF